MNSIKKTVLSIVAVMTLTFFSSSAQGQLKIGYVDYVKVIDSIPSYLEAQRTLQLYYEMSLRTLNDMDTELNRKVKEYEAGEGTLPEIIRQSQREELETQNQILMMKQEEIQRKYEEMTMELIAPIEKNVILAIKNVAAKNKITYVLQYDPENASTGLLYVDTTPGSPAVDLSMEVRAELIRLEAIRTGGSTTGQ